jgi:hypothetical protein
MDGCGRLCAMQIRSSILPLCLAMAVLAAGCGSSSDDGEPVVTMDRAASAAIARAQATAEGAESVGYQTRANKAWQSRQNGYETLKRERCKRRHPQAACRIEHIKLLNH